MAEFDSENRSEKLQDDAHMHNPDEVSGDASASPDQDPEASDYRPDELSDAENTTELTEAEEEPEPEVKAPNVLSGLVAWMAAGILCLALVYLLLWQPQIAKLVAETQLTVASPEYQVPENFDEAAAVAMPALKPTPISDALNRDPLTHTFLNKAYRPKPVSYTVEEGDSVTFISEKFGIKPITILYNNYDVLNDQMDFLKVGDVLTIAPVDGILHKWRNKDTIESVASKYGTTIDAIKLFPGNDLDLSNPTVQPGTIVMVPGGSREIVEPALPVLPGVASSGPNTSGIPAGASGCGKGSAYIGSGIFIWPSSTHFISGNTFGPGHNGIDIGAGEGTPVFASDSGTVVYAGWLEPGYGYMVEIDHGNGYYTIYEHLISAPEVSNCQKVNQGEVIGYCGNTGNSFGAHIHFGILTAAGAVNPLDYLP